MPSSGLTLEFNLKLLVFRRDVSHPKKHSCSRKVRGKQTLMERRRGQGNRLPQHLREALDITTKPESPVEPPEPRGPPTSSSDMFRQVALLDWVFLFLSCSGFQQLSFQFKWY